MKTIKQSGRRGRAQHDGPVKWMDGSALLRPFDPPKSVMAFCAAGALVAALAGGFVGFKAIDQVLHGEERAAAEVHANVERGVSYDLPIMQDYIGKKNSDILDAFDAAGYVTKDFTPDGETGLDVVKAPSDAEDPEVVFAAYESGMTNVSAIDASMYLVGSWRFNVDRSEGTTMRVYYSDLAAQDPQDAIDSAMEAQGWDSNSKVEVLENGEDEMGNTFREGTIKTKSGKKVWRISVCDLSAVYGISGLPEDAQYVGIRITK